MAKPVGVTLCEGPGTMSSSSNSEADEVYTGTVKWYNFKKGYGFISSDEFKKVFVHKSAITSRRPKSRGLMRGEEVEFCINETEKGIQAVEVTGPNSRPVKGARYFRKQGSRSRPTTPRPPTPIPSGTEESNIESPYLGQKVLKSMIDEGYKGMFYPTEWVGLRDRNKIVQVVYPELPENFATVAIKSLANLKYKVFINEVESKVCEGKDLMKLKLEDTQAFIPSGDRQAASAHNEAFEETDAPELGNVWIKQADADFKILEHLVKQRQLKPYAMACFLAQQVAEKAMKGGIIHFGIRRKGGHGRDVRYFHKLEDIVEALRVDMATEENANAYARLKAFVKKIADGDYYTKTRYPDSWENKHHTYTLPVDNYTEKEAKNACENAKNIKTIIQQQLLEL